MANIYVSLIQKGLRTIEEVPKTIRKEVQAILDAEIAAQDCFLFAQKRGEYNGSSLRDVDYQRQEDDRTSTWSDPRTSERNLTGYGFTRISRIDEAYSDEYFFILGKGVVT